MTPKNILNNGKKYRDKLKNDVFSYYGDACMCCGESERSFLCIDHINGNGKKHRDKVGTGQALLRWIIKNNYPSDLQLLCFNCNQGKRMNNGVCPHKKGFIHNYEI